MTAFELFFAAFLGGIAGHQTRRFTIHITSGWRNLTEHGIGVLLLMPFILLFWVAYGGQRKDLPRLVAVLTSAGLAVGGGVAAGWVLDSIAWRDEK